MKTALHETRILVIGSGIAGLSAAITAAEKGIDTTIITSAPSIVESNTAHAQGGIITESETSDPASPFQRKDDFRGRLLLINYPPAVHQVVGLGPKLVRELLIEKAGVPFDREGSGYHLTREGGHSAHRILHRGDESGKSIEECLVADAQTLPRLTFLKHTTAINLLMTPFHCLDRTMTHGTGNCFGAFVFDQHNREIYPLVADHTVLATGGIGQLYLHNTNSKFSRGDGVALAYRAGCRLANMEYVQFHPTTFFHPRARRFLVSESLRGEGALLVNQAGERFGFKYLPEYPVPELAPRDRVAKMIHQEMLSTEALCVYLDISHKPADWIRERFPFVHRSCLNYGVDITTQPIPVVPGAHYHCGGVWTDLEGRTSVANLWAAGEVACTGLHGANRLASTSLLEGLVWGTRVGEAIDAVLDRGIPTPRPEIREWESVDSPVDPSFLRQDWLTLKHTMWNYVGLIKTEARLHRAHGILTELSQGIESFYRKAGLSDELIGLRHASLAARLILKASERNTKSLGCYLREELEI